MTMFYKITFVVFLLFCMNNVQAQQNNSVQRKYAGKYQIELSACCTTLDFHIYNYKGNPVRGLSIKGYADLFYPDGSQITILLQQYEQSDLLSANVTYPGFGNLKVSFIIGEEKIFASFRVEHYHMVENNPEK